MTIEATARVVAEPAETSVQDVSAEYLRATGEAIESTLNIDSWLPAERYIETIGRLQAEIDASLQDVAVTTAATTGSCCSLLQPILLT